MSNHNSQTLRDMLAEARRRGKCAFHEGDDITDNPYNSGLERAAWRAGWLHSSNDAPREQERA